MMAQSLYRPPRRPAPTVPVAPTAARPLETPAQRFEAGGANPLQGGTRTAGASVYKQEEGSTAGLPFRDVSAMPSPAGDQLAGYEGSAQQAVATALREMGYDPGSSNPAVGRLLESADAIQEAYLIQRVLSGQGQTLPADPTTASQEYAQFVRNVVGRGSTRAVASQAQRGLGAASRTIQQMMATGDNPFAALSPELRAATQVLGTDQGYLNTLGNLYSQMYQTPGDQTRASEAQRRLQQMSARSLAGISPLPLQ